MDHSYQIIKEQLVVLSATSHSEQDCKIKKKPEKDGIRP